MLQCLALLAGLLVASLASANPQGRGFPEAAQASGTALNFGGSKHSLLDLPPVLPLSLLPVLVAQAAIPGMGTLFDATQISPLGDPAWVAAMRGPDPSKPIIYIERGAVNPIREQIKLPLTGIDGGDATVRNGQVLRNGRVFLIGAQRSALNKGGSILLAPGRAAELGDLGVPFVRVHVVAPTGTALDVDGLVGKRPVIGIFNALFAPLPARRGDSGATAVASLSAPAPLRAPAANPVLAGVAVKTAPPPVKPEPVAYAAQVEDRSVAWLPIPPAMVEERLLVAYAAPVEDRSGALMSIPAAAVEDRLILAFAAPVEDRSGVAASIPPASVEDRSFVMFVAPVEDRSAWLASIPPASVEDRSFTAFVASVEERSAMLAAIPPATVEERSFMAFAAPVEDKAFAQRPLLPAPIEERAPVMVARDIGKPLPGPINEPTLAAAKDVSGAPATGLVKVALAAPVVVVAADSNAVRRTEASNSAPAPVKLAAIQRRLPNIMIDRRGGYFFM
ncbi:MAG: hypothetical protein A3H35_17275 [Betaproteobacteria bacterium RIFCSPLOWO2_02_FULL_62_17]|nr:MAG: hypothetical protein A3H35_17275 [Betaproteobacteria bacterium RIFCSPLOWO2_02_FULL_62_17]